MDEVYMTAVDALTTELAPRILAWLNKASAALTAAGYEASSPAFDMSDDEYRYVVELHVGEAHTPLSLVVTIDEQAAYEGEGDGINFHFLMTTEGGRILAEMAPYNFTPQVWVPVADHAALIARWELIEQSDLGELVRLAQG